jgi:hypothetical protein
MAPRAAATPERAAPPLRLPLGRLASKTMMLTASAAAMMMTMAMVMTATLAATTIAEHRH